MNDKDVMDCVIIGGGPAGLTAGLYLARYRRKALIFDTMNSRADKIPLSHNCSGFPEGISGKGLLTKMRQQLADYHLPLVYEEVTRLAKTEEEMFLVQTMHSKVYAKNLIIASGVQDVEPSLTNVRKGVQKGLIRYCPVCDGYEVIDKKVAVIGYGKSGLGEALFLRDFSSRITLLTLGIKDDWAKKDLQLIKKSKVSIIPDAIFAIKQSSHFIEITFSNQKTDHFDCLYSALGSIKNNKLALNLHLKLKNGSIVVNKDQETSVKGVFAAGDIVSGLNQICVATSQAAIAATAIHNRCRRFSY